VEARDLARWLLESGLDARLSLQLHKVMWGAEARGV
jgi:7-carboxy-7-deazaguanine synthase